MAAYDSNGDLFSQGQLGNTTTTEGVFLQELPSHSSNWGDFFPTLTFTDAKTVDFYDFDSPALVIDNHNSPNCLYVTAWEVGYKLSNHDPLTAVAVGHSSTPEQVGLPRGFPHWLPLPISRLTLALQWRRTVPFLQPGSRTMTGKIPKSCVDVGRRRQYLDRPETIIDITHNGAPPLATIVRRLTGRCRTPASVCTISRN